MADHNDSELAAYVLHHDHDGVRPSYHFTGPFTSVVQAGLWADARFSRLVVSTCSSLRVIRRLRFL